VDFSEEERWLLLRRGRTGVALNFSAEPRHVAVRGASLLLASEDSVRLDSGGLKLPGHSAAIVSLPLDV